MTFNRKTFVRAALAATATPLILAPEFALADGIVDAKLGQYFRFDNDTNIRIDKIESVRHYDGRPIAANLGSNDDEGYLIYSVSIQNPGPGTHFLPGFGVAVFFEDQSKLDLECQGPFVGTGTKPAPDSLEAKESIRVRYAQGGWKGERITKIVLDPNQSARPKRRLTIKAGDIVEIAEVPKPQPTS